MWGNITYLCWSCLRSSQKSAPRFPSLLGSAHNQMRCGRCTALPAVCRLSLTRWEPVSRCCPWPAGVQSKQTTTTKKKKLVKSLLRFDYKLLIDSQGSVSVTGKLTSAVSDIIFESWLELFWAPVGSVGKLRMRSVAMRAQWARCPRVMKFSQRGVGWVVTGVTPY